MQCAFMVGFPMGFGFCPADLILFLGWVLLDLVLLEDGSCWICCIGLGLLLYFLEILCGVEVLDG
jgi:hypothetical protein